MNRVDSQKLNGARVGNMPASERARRAKYWSVGNGALLIEMLLNGSNDYAGAVESAISDGFPVKIESLKTRVREEQVRRAVVATNPRDDDSEEPVLERAWVAVEDFVQKAVEYRLRREQKLMVLERDQLRDENARLAQRVKELEAGFERVRKEHDTKALRIAGAVKGD